jgi:cation:H+ antiporter
MLVTISLLLAMLVVILIASELFTNALEHLGHKLRISEGVTGSLFAAVGTALPETIVPILALLSTSGSSTTNEDIGIGAILGAPLMLSTLSTCLMATAVVKTRGALGHVRPERSGLARDLNFFLVAFLLAAAAMYIPAQLRGARIAVSVVLVLTYVTYIWLTLRASNQLVEEGHGTTADEQMYLCRLGLPDVWAVLILQLACALSLLIAGAKGFIYGIEEGAKLFGISALLLSLIIIPIATELPEKVNSILWIRRGKDTLAVGNITGAMVFQGTLLPALGIAFTAWQPRVEVVAGIAITFAAAAWLRVNLAVASLRVWMLLANGLLYGTYLWVALEG